MSQPPIIYNHYTNLIINSKVFFLTLLDKYVKNIKLKVLDLLKSNTFKTN